MRQSPEIVKRWVNEVQEAANSDNIMVQVCVVIYPFPLAYLLVRVRFLIVGLNKSCRF